MSVIDSFRYTAIIEIFKKLFQHTSRLYGTKNCSAASFPVSLAFSATAAIPRFRGGLSVGVTGMLYSSPLVLPLTKYTRLSASSTPWLLGGDASPPPDIQMPPPTAVVCGSVVLKSESNVPSVLWTPAIQPV